jgi:hypothetical protein
MSELFVDRADDEWNYFLPTDKSPVYEINTFDDGNQKYHAYDNKWFITGTWNGKCALVNCLNPTVKITSISLWKLSKILY